MKINQLSILIISVSLAVFCSCRKNINREASNYQYFDKPLADTLVTEKLIAITNDDYLDYGARVAYVNEQMDTVIPFGKYAFFGTDTLDFYANVLEHPTDSTYGRAIAIDQNQNILFDIVMFDNGPDPFNEGLTRVLRNGKMGYANKYGQVVIPCVYDYAKWFENGQAEVTYHAKVHTDFDEHRIVESDEWFRIDKKGKKME